MNKVNSLIVLLFFIPFISCEDEGSINETSTIYLEDTFAEIYQINNVSATPHTQNNSTNSITNQIDISEFNGADLSSFSIRTAAPIDNSVSINTSIESVYIVLKNNEQASPFFESGEVGNIINSEGIDRQEFLFNFTYPSNATPIDIGNIDYLYLVYTFDYTDNVSGTTIHSKTIDHTVYFEGGSSCDQEISTVNYSDLTIGDACGNPASIRLFYTNDSNTSIKIRFTVVDENGEWSGQDLELNLNSGETTNQYFCNPKIINNQFCYQILIKNVSSTCDFPDVQDIPVCNGF